MLKGKVAVITVDTRGIGFARNKIKKSRRKLLCQKKKFFKN